MSSLLKQRARISRVRRLQHNIAASSVAEANMQLRQLEGSSERLTQMRLDLGARVGETTGALMASAGELAMRLDAARVGLAPSIDAARAAVAMKEEKRLHARRDQESAERLEQRSVSALEAIPGALIALGLCYFIGARKGNEPVAA